MMKTFCFYGSALALVLMIGATAVGNSNLAVAMLMNISATVIFGVISVWSVWEGLWS